MATYDSVHTGEQVDNAVDIVLGNKSKGSATQPIYLDANGAAQNVNVDATPTDSSANLVQSGGVFTQLSTKYAKADISTDPNLGTSNTVIPSQGAVKSYVDTKLATKQDVVVAGDGIVKEGNTLSISTDNDFMTAGKLDNKWSHFVSGLDMGYGTETIEKMENAKRSAFDVSKFTVNGTTGLTSDGVIPQGLYGSNYVRPNYLLPLWNNEPWEVITPLYTINPSGSNTHSMLRYLQGFYYEPAGANRDDGINLGYANTTTSVVFTFDAYYGTGGSNRDTISGSISKPINNPLQFKMVNTGTQYELYYRENGVGAWTLIDTKAKNHDFTHVHTEKMSISYFSVVDYTMQGSTDLKYMSIKDDGTETFNGCKTGIDVIKLFDTTPVEGSLAITDNHIASGFSTSNYINVGNLLSSNNPVVEFAVTVTSAITDGLEFCGNSVASGMFLIGTTASGKIMYTSLSQSVNDTDIDMPINQKVYFKIAITNGITNSFYYKTSKTAEYTLLGTTSATFTSQPLYLGRGYSTSFTGTMDLDDVRVSDDSGLIYLPVINIPYTLTKDGKKIVDSIYRDRVEDEYTQAGFTPYYTLDTESRGNYTVVGSPTISSDFVASGFSNSNYVTFPFIIGNYTNFNTFKIKIKKSASATGMLWSTNDRKFYLYQQATNKLAVAWRGAGTTNIIYKEFTVNSNTLVYEVLLTQTSLTLYEDGVINSEGTVTITTEGINTNGVYCTIGVWGSDLGSAVSGSIDLKQFSITVDGKLAYQAVIPPNYTMATVKESAIVDSYNNGMNKWTKYANLDFIQQGSCTSGTAVQFAKPFRDANYALSVPYTSGTKTATGFTPSFTGNCDYIAKGKCNLNFPQE